MPKLLAGRHYNEEEIKWHLKKIRILGGPNEWQQVCNRSNPKKTGTMSGENRYLVYWRPVGFVKSPVELGKWRM